MPRVLAFVGFVLLATPLAAQTSAEHAAVFQAWEDGRYLAALEEMQRLLTAPGGDRHVASFAVLTGERYRTVEVAADGRNPRWSADGQHLAFEVVVDGRTRTRIARRDGQTFRVITEVEGRAVTFHPVRPEIAYVVLTPGPELDAERAALRRDRRPTSRTELRALERDLEAVESFHNTVVIRGIVSGPTRTHRWAGIGVTEIAYGSDGSLLLAANHRDTPGISDIWRVSGSSQPTRLTSGPGRKAHPIMSRDGRSVAYQGADFAGRVEISGGSPHQLRGIEYPVLAADGVHAAFLRTVGSQTAVFVTRLETGATPIEVARVNGPVDGLNASADGRRVAFQVMEREDWEVFVAGAESAPTRVTFDVQHDLFPTFLPGDGVTGPRDGMLVIKGEGRHRRSYLYDLADGREVRLFHNNTVRTVAPEYEWAVTPDATQVAIVSERDGDTISPERGLYVVDLTALVSKQELLQRIASQLAAERQLRAEGERMFAALAGTVRTAVADVSRTRIYGYEKDLFAYGSKYITQPGNARAIDYLALRLREFGYEPELQWFEPRRGVRSANVIATLRGTQHPDVTYVISSHFDSVERGPGADDNTSGTAALLEAARVLRTRPMAATIKFAFFTGEEAGLLGSREFVRRAVADSMKLVGALNNDMIGYANDARLDNTIRYSNDGIRDLQHAAAMLFTDLITYDAKYYKSTDAHAYYDAYGDIVGGIGSYPILANPHYHQSHDVLETINHQLVAEVSKATIASIMLMASSPSRVAGVRAVRSGRSVTLSWNRAVEPGVRDYVVVVWNPDGSEHSRRTVVGTSAVVDPVATGATVGVKAVGASGLESWDWGRTTVP